MTDYAALYDSSVDNARRAHKSEELHYRRHVVKPWPTENHKRARLQFALDHVNFDLSNVFSSLQVKKLLSPVNTDAYVCGAEIIRDKQVVM